MDELVEWGVQLPDGRVQGFRFRDAAEEHLRWRKRTHSKSPGSLVSRTVQYSGWQPLDSTMGLASHPTVEAQEARIQAAAAVLAEEDRRWRLAAEAVLGALHVNGEPAIEFIARVVAMGERAAQGVTSEPLDPGADK